MIRSVFAPKRRQRSVPAESSAWQKVTAFAGLGRLLVSIGRLWREWMNGEGPSTSL
jgi:hypothetical protein